MPKFILPLLAIFLVAGAASAADASTVVHATIGPSTTAHFVTGADWRNGSVQASTTMEAHNGKATPEMRASTTMQMHKELNAPGIRAKIAEALGVPGIVTGIGTDSFTISAPGGKDHATTTLTVNVSSSTKYDNASTTAAFSNLAVGSHVIVIGTVATSTHTVAATRVVITSAPIKEVKKEIKGLGNILSHLKDIFGKHASSTVNVQGSTTAAAAVQGGLVNSILHKLLGWL